MARNRKRTFADVVWKQYSEDIEKAVISYVDENWQQLDLHTNWVKNPNEAYCDGCRFYRLIPYLASDNKVVFDVAVIADINIFETSHSQANDGEVEKWLRVSCEAILDNGLHNFQINGIDEYNHHENKMLGLLSDSLVPMISRKNYEYTAETILKQYYPEVLQLPTQVDVYKLAERMGLKIKKACLTKAGTIFGAMIFNDCEIDYYDEDLKRFCTMELEGKTILVDPKVYFMRTIGSLNNTVAHECVHWALHKQVFELERINNEDVRMIRCQVVEKETYDAKNPTDTDWMELHANALAPRILMPYKTFKRKAELLIKQYKRELGTDITADVMQLVIEELHDFFGVSKQAARLRMIDIGYTEAIGVYEYIDSHYIQPHSFKSGVIDSNQSFSIPAVDATIQYTFNPDLRRILDTGNFVYIDSHLCIDDPLYVTRNNFGILEMTAYAIAHIDECCLTFDRSTRPNAEYGAHRYTECMLFQNAVSANFVEHLYDHNDHNKEVEARAAALRAEQEEVKEVTEILKKLPKEFNESLIMLMKWYKMTNEDLAEAALLSSKTIQRCRTEPDHNCDLETVIAICFGLHLHPKISDELIKQAGHNIKTGEQGITYAHLLATRYKCSIHEVNEYLENAGYPKLSGKE